MKNRFLILIVFVLFVSTIYSQKRKRIYHIQDKTQAIAKAYMDTLSILYNRYCGIQDSSNNEYFLKEIKLNPLYYKLFVPLTFYSLPAKQAFEPEWKSMKLEEKGDPVNELFPIDISSISQTDIIGRRVNKVLMSTYVAHPELVKITEEQIMRRKSFRKDIAKSLPPKVNLADLFVPDPIEANVGTAGLYVRKPNFWSFDGHASLQFTQNYISSNWYKGGESTNSMLSSVKLVANYDDKQQLEFENSMELKLGFLTTPSDTVHKYKTNSDLFRLYSKLGLKAISKWYYTISAEFTTQFFSVYKTNTNIEQAGLFSPASFKVNLGMDYKVNKKKINLSVMISPFAYNYVYVADRNVDPTAFGIKPGRNVLHEFGSTFQTSMKWTVIPAIVWESRLYYFTNYRKSQAEWENTINFVLNRYLSTQVFIHARFDDGIKPLDDHSYFQLKELLSFGLNYTW